jgi:hypothetical protein
MPQVIRKTIDYEAVYEAMDRKRQRHNLSWRAAVEQITGGQNPSLPSRLRDGRPVTADTLGSIILWLDVDDIRPFLIPFRKGRRFT